MRANSATVPKTRAGVSTPLGVKKRSKSIATGYIIVSCIISSCAWDLKIHFNMIKSQQDSHLVAFDLRIPKP